MSGGVAAVLELASKNGNGSVGPGRVISVRTAGQGSEQEGSGGMKVHHIGYLVKKLPGAAAAFEKLGYVRLGEVVADAYRKIDILFLKKDGYVVELVSPNAPDSVVSGLVKTYKNAPYHICYLCRDLEKELTQLTSAGYLQMDEPTPAPALEDRRVCFLMHPQMGMIELLEERPPAAAE